MVTGAHFHFIDNKTPGPSKLVKERQWAYYLLHRNV